VGDEIMVMVTEVDQFGRINLSRRAVLEGLQPEDVVKAARAAQPRPGPRQQPPPPGRRPPDNRFRGPRPQGPQRPPPRRGPEPPPPPPPRPPSSFR